MIDENQLDPVVGASSLALTMHRKPAEVLREAREAALALKEVLDAKPDPVKINGEVYLEAEDWATVAAFFNCAAKTRATQPVQFGNVAGFEASADCVNLATGQVVSSAESMCLNDEERWSSRPRYEWMEASDERAKGKRINRKGGGRVQVFMGDEQVPLFQLRSMAQTRACARANKQAFSWVVVLAGYKPSIAEEMTGTEHPREREPVDSPRRRSTAKDEAPKKITEGAIALVKHRQHAKGVSDLDLVNCLGTVFGIEALEELPMDKVNDLIAWIDQATPPPAA